MVRSGGAQAHFSSQHGSFWRLERLIFVALAPSVRSLRNIGRSYDFGTSELVCDTPKSTENRRNARLHSDARPGRPTWTPKAPSWLPRRPTCRPQDGFRGARDGALGAFGGVPIVPRSVPRTTLGAPRPPRSISGCDFGRLGRPRPRFWHASWTVLATCDPPCRSFGETCAATMHSPLHQRCTKVSAPSIYIYIYMCRHIYIYIYIYM